MKIFQILINAYFDSGLVLELKVIASTSSSASSKPYLDPSQNQVKIDQTPEKLSNLQNYENSTNSVARGSTSSPLGYSTNRSLLSNSNFSGNYTTSNSTPNSSLISTAPLNNRQNRNTIGLGPLGMSALFYSFLKNNTKGVGPAADSGYESRMDNSAKINRASTLYQETDKNSTNKSMPLAQLKLKNLQEVIAKTYSKEEFSNYGIMVPNVQSTNLTQNKENSNKIQFSNYSNSGSIDNPIDSKMNQKYINYNATPLSTKGMKFLQYFPLYGFDVNFFFN